MNTYKIAKPLQNCQSGKNLPNLVTLSSSHELQLGMLLSNPTWTRFNFFPVESSGWIGIIDLSRS